MEYADGVSVALSAVQKLKYNGKARESSETAGRNAEECLISQVPSLLRAAEVLHGLYKIVERCKFEEDSEVPRFGTRDNVERMKRREQELLRLKNGMTGWVRELQDKLGRRFLTQVMGVGNGQMMSLERRNVI